MNLLDLNSYMADMVFEYVPNIRRAGSNRLNFKCPLCGDGKKNTSHRGWFYTDTGSYYCWNAGCIANESGLPGLKFLSLVSGKPINEIRAELVKRAGTFKNYIKYPTKNKTINIFDDEDEEKSKIDEKLKQCIIDKLEIGEWTETLPKYAQIYINKRKLLNAPFLPDNFKFYFDKNKSRLVIPWTDEYYQERTILKSQKNEDKYLFPPNVEKPIFGLDKLDPDFKYIFILEGVFDSIWVKNGIAVGSLTLSTHQKNILKEYKNNYQLIYMPDNQFVDNSSFEKTIKICKESPFENIFIWPKQFSKFKDVNDSIMYSDKCIDAWKSKEFLIQHVANGIKALMTIRKS